MEWKVKSEEWKVKAAIKREQSDACISYAEREQARCETSIVKNSCLGKRAKDTISYRRSVSAVASLKNLGTTKRPNDQTTNFLND